MKTKEQRIKEWKIKIDSICDAYMELDSAVESFLAIGAMAPNGRLFEAIWKAFETQLRIIDVEEWISWHIHENGCGAKELKAGYDGKSWKIKTSRDLAKLIVEGEDRA